LDDELKQDELNIENSPVNKTLDYLPTHSQVL